MTRTVLIPLINYGFLAFVEQACNVLIPLVWATSIPFGGLGFSSFTIGMILSILGIVNGFASVLFFPWLLLKVGIWKLYMAAFGSNLVILGGFPLTNYLAKRAGHIDGFVWCVLMVQMCAYILGFMTYGEQSPAEWEAPSNKLTHFD